MTIPSYDDSSVMLDKVFLSVFSNLKILYGKYYILNDFIYNYKRQPNLDTYYKHIKLDHFSSTKPADEIEDLKLVNTCLYVYAVVMPSLLDVELRDYIDKLKSEMKRVKTNWIHSVRYHAKNNKVDKFILRRLKNSKADFSSDLEKNAYTENYVSNVINELNKWKGNDDEQLSSFQFIDELRFKQLQSLIMIECPYILCCELVSIDDHPLWLHVKHNIGKANDGKTIDVPLTLLVSDNQFGFKKRKLEDFIFEEKNGQLHLALGEGTTEILDAVDVILGPNDKPIISVSEDYISSNSAHFRSITDAIALSSDQILEGRQTVEIPMKDLCKRRGIAPASKNYEKILSEFALLMSKKRVDIRKDKVGFVQYINSVYVAKDNPEQQMMLTLEWHKSIVNDIWTKQTKRIFDKQLEGLKDLDYLLVRLLIMDYKNRASNDTKDFVYPSQNLMERLDLINASGKPSYKRKQINESFLNIYSKKMSILSSYEATPDLMTFYISFNDEHIDTVEA